MFFLRWPAFTWRILEILASFKRDEVVFFTTGFFLRVAFCLKTAIARVRMKLPSLKPTLIVFNLTPFQVLPLKTLTTSPSKPSGTVVFFFFIAKLYICLGRKK